MTIRNVFTTSVAVALVMLAACGGESPDTAGKGRVAIVMSASGDAFGSAGAALAADSMAHESCAPVLESATVTFSSILARTLEGVLTDVTIDLPVDVDLLALGGKEATLPVGFLPPGTYDQLVVVMTRVELTLANGTKIAVTPPGGGWTAIVRVAEPFTVVEGETTTVSLRFRRDLSFGCGGGRWTFHPEFECDGGRVRR
jgi:hypothetical protein